MNKALLATLAVCVLCGISKAAAQTPTIESLPPVIVKTFPESGTEVASGDVEIKITFSKAMKDNSWSWSSAWENSTPEFAGKPSYDSEHKTCTVKVKLEPGKTYGFWLNSEKFKNFRDAQGHPAVPYLLVFKTKP